MARVYADRVMETSTSTGTGNITLAGAVSGYQTFAANVMPDDTFDYVIYEINGSGQPTGAWETGRGHIQLPDTLVRDEVQDSSSGGGLVNFAAGTKHVMLSHNAASLAWQASNLARFVPAVRNMHTFTQMPGGDSYALPFAPLPGNVLLVIYRQYQQDSEAPIVSEGWVQSSTFDAYQLQGGVVSRVVEEGDSTTIQPLLDTEYHTISVFEIDKRYIPKTGLEGFVAISGEAASPVDLEFDFGVPTQVVIFGQNGGGVGAPTFPTYSAPAELAPFSAGNFGVNRHGSAALVTLEGDAPVTVTVTSGYSSNVFTARIVFPLLPVQGDLFPTEAPKDGKLYGRKDGDWAEITTTGDGGGGDGGSADQSSSIVQLIGGRNTGTGITTLTLPAPPTPGNVLVVMSSGAGAAVLPVPRGFVTAVVARTLDASNGDSVTRLYGAQYQVGYVAYRRVAPGDGVEIAFPPPLTQTSDPRNYVVCEVADCDRVEAFWSQGVVQGDTTKARYPLPLPISSKGLWLTHVEHDEISDIVIDGGQGVVQDFQHSGGGNHRAVTGHGAPTGATLNVTNTAGVNVNQQLALFAVCSTR